MARVTREWAVVRTSGEVPPGATRVTFKLLLHCHGQAWFDDAMGSIVRVVIHGSRHA